MHRRIATSLLAALLASAGAASAQDFVFGWNPRTGDVWVDQTLGDINQYGYRYRESFVDELVRYYDAPRDYVSGLLLNDRWAPGDVYYACAIGEIIGRSCQYVAEQWEQDHGQGWGALAQRLGIKPGSEAFHRLKQGFVPTYDHWARPLPLDDALHAAFPDRRRDMDAPGKSGMAHGNSGSHGKAGDNGKAHGKSGHAAKANAGKGNAGKGQAKGNQGKSDGHGNSGGKDKDKGKAKGKGNDKH